MNLIKRNHPVRQAVASLENYHDTKSDALTVIQAHLNDHNMEMDFNGGVELSGDEGQTLIPISFVEDYRPCCSSCTASLEKKPLDSCVVFCWFRMPSGRVEITTYLS